MPGTTDEEPLVNRAGVVTQGWSGGMSSEQSVVLTERDFRVGDMVEVRSLDEIIATLDENGEYENLPFMPEMARYCGQSLVVYKRAHKLCDTITKTGMYRMRNAVHLSGARCDGSAHDGCQAACLMYWKTAWLKAFDPAAIAPQESAPLERSAQFLNAATRRQPDEDGEERYRCQATEMLRAAPELLPLRDVRQHIDDVVSGNSSILAVIRACAVSVFNRLQSRLSSVLPERFLFRGGRPWGAVHGTAGKTPTAHLELQPGELVRVRPRAEIAATLDKNHFNRGLAFDAEMARFCGREARVACRVDRIIDERSGRMLRMRQPCIVLEGLVCEGAYSTNCPRAITPYWREIWLERVVDQTTK